jgi:hypothetical protein
MIVVRLISLPGYGLKLLVIEQIVVFLYGKVIVSPALPLPIGKGDAYQASIIDVHTDCSGDAVKWLAGIIRLFLWCVHRQGLYMLVYIQADLFGFIDDIADLLVKFCHVIGTEYGAGTTYYCAHCKYNKNFHDRFS